MGYYYVLSDIHGFYRELYARFDQLGNLHTIIDDAGEDKLILAWLGADIDLKTSKTFLLYEQFAKVKELAKAGNMKKVYSYITLMGRWHLVVIFLYCFMIKLKRNTIKLSV